MASKLLRSAPGDTAPGREWGGVWMPLVCSGGLRSVLPSAPSVWHREAAFCSQLRSMEPKRRSFCSGSDPRLGARASPTFSSHPSVAPGVPGDMSCTGLSKEAPPGAAAPGDKLPPLSTGELSPLAGERLPSREPEGVWRWALGLRVPQRPLTHGASSVVLTGDWERYSRVSGTRAGGVALMGEGREFRLGLSGALPLGAWLKTTTHCPTCKRGEGMGYGLLGGMLAQLGQKGRELGAFRAGKYTDMCERAETPLHLSQSQTHPAGRMAPQLRGSMVLILHLEWLPRPGVCLHVQQPGVFEQL